ncbi:hypothetical protein RJ641_006449 [Dillenia turbinata]|uniref:Uncharacterized protein n=1 Tax=Dillenia turbinata TaxID=194707 RepID=A0AAN8ZBT3_9MAGN
MENKALAMIPSCLSDKVLRELMDEKIARLLMLKEERPPVKCHVDEFDSIISDLSSIGVKVDHEEQATTLLCSFSPLYKNFRETFLFIRESIILRQAKSTLFCKDVMGNHMDECSKDSDGNALNVRERSEEK